jgi:PAS domain S-box-containing protein
LTNAEDISIGPEPNEDCATEAAPPSSQRILETLPQLIWTCDPDGQCDFVGPQWAYFTHEAESEFLGSGWANFVHPDDKPVILERWAHSVRTGTDLYTAFRMRRHDGQYRWFHVHGRPIRDGSGKVTKWVGANLDVHAAHEMSAALEFEKQRLARIVATAPGAFCAFEESPTGQLRCSYASSGVEQIFGLPPEALVSDANRIWELIHPADVDRVKATSAASARTGSEWACECRVLHAEKGKIWIEAHGVPSREPDGSVTFHTFLRDVTDRKRLERRVRLRSDALENSLAAFGIVSREGKLLYVNATYLKLWGYDRLEEVVGTVPTSHCVDRDLPKTIVRLVAQNGSCSVEFTARRKDGSTFEVLMSVQQSIDEQGAEIYLATAIDITERKRAEQALRDSREQMVAALEAAGTGTWQLDARTNVIWADDAALKLCGRTREEVGQGELERALSFVHPEDRARIQQELAGFLKQGDEALLELRILRNDGSVRWIGVKGRANRDADGLPVQLRGAIIDITDRIRAQESQRLEALGTLAGGIAHDFNNMLLAIAANTALAAADLPREHPVQEYLTEIERAGTRASQLVQRILTFSRPEAHELRMLQLRCETEEALRLLRATVPAMIEIRTQFAADLPAVRADSTQIHQIVINLMTNAVHAVGPRGGVIDVRLESVRVSPQLSGSVSGLRPGRYARLTVSDNGCGMDRGTMERIFDPFFTTKPSGQGTGLGLSVVHGIMKSYDGAVAVYSEPNRGAAFHLYFPAHQCAEDTPIPRAPEVPAGRGQRVLYVDDERPLVRVTTRILQRLGYVVTGFSEPAEAVKVFRSRPNDFDVVVTDLSMPGMSGLDFAREVLTLRSDLPILMTSGYVSPDDRDAAIALGIRELIAKPAVMEQLGHALARLFPSP